MRRMGSPSQNAEAPEPRARAPARAPSTGRGHWPIPGRFALGENGIGTQREQDQADAPPLAGAEEAPPGAPQGREEGRRLARPYSPAAGAPPASRSSSALRTSSASDSTSIFSMMCAR